MVEEMVSGTLVEVFYNPQAFDTVETSSSIANLQKEAQAKLYDYYSKSNFSFGIYRKITQELLTLFSDVKIKSSENKLIPIRVIQGLPSRAQSKRETNIILPIMSLTQMESESNSDRSRYEPILTHRVVWHKEKQRAMRALSFAPTPVDVTYALSIWTKYKSDYDQVLNQIMLKFTPSLEVWTNEGRIHGFISEIANESDFHPDDGSDRDLKCRIIFTVEGWIRYPEVLYTSTGKIEQLNLEVLEIPDGENLGEFTYQTSTI